MSKNVAHLVQEENRTAIAMPAATGARTKAMKAGRVWRTCNQIFVAGRWEKVNAAKVIPTPKMSKSQSVSSVKENLDTSADGSKMKAINNASAQTEIAPLNFA